MAALETPSWRPEPMSDRIVVRCYSNYQDAKRAVDCLRVASIPRKRITVFGRGLRWREAFTATRLAKAAAGGGSVLAAGVALILWAAGGLDNGFSWVGAALAGAGLGALVGAALGAVAWLATRRDPTVPETGHVDVDHYEVLVELAHADRARELLGAEPHPGT
jgi:hypothetical protein